MAFTGKTALSAAHIHYSLIKMVLCLLLLCIGCTAFGRFRRLALGPGVHGIGAERRVYSSVSFRSSKKRSTNLFGPFFSFSVKGLPRLSADAR